MPEPVSDARDHTPPPQESGEVAYVPDFESLPDTGTTGRADDFLPATEIDMTPSGAPGDDHSSDNKDGSQGNGEGALDYLKIVPRRSDIKAGGWGDFTFLNESDTPAADEEAAVSQVSGADGASTWRRSQENDWSLFDSRGQTVEVRGLDPSSDSVVDVERMDDQSIRLQLASGEILRNRPDGSTLRFANQETFDKGQPEKVYRSNDTTIELNWNGDRLDSANLSKPYYQVGDNIWSADPDAKSGWNGTIEVDGRTGDISITALAGQDRGVTNFYRATGQKEIHKPGGSVEFTMDAEHENTSRTFKFSGGFQNGTGTLEQPLEMTVTDASGKEHTWRHVGGDQYEVNGSKKNARIEVSRDSKGDLSYKFADLDSGYTKQVLAGKTVETEVTGDETTVKENGQVVERKIGATTISYDGSESAERITDADNNRVWTKGADGKWMAAPLDSSQTYEQPDDFHRQIFESPHLDAEQKVRMAESVKLIDADTQIEDRDEFYKQASRLLDSEKNGTVFSADERADLAEQLLWHVAHDGRNEQGAHNTCNVTDVRGSFLIENPSHVAKLVADVTETGEFVTKDGSVIKPPLDSLRPREGSPESTFPVPDGNRTWLGQFWDVTAANVFWQRQTTGPDGKPVAKGSIRYKQIAPSGRSDNGERIVKVDDQGREWTLAREYTDGSTKNADNPLMYMDRILDVYEQVSGEKPDCRGLVHKDRYVGDKQLFDDVGGKRVSSVEELREALRTADGDPVIVSLNTGILRQRKAQQEAIDRGEDPSSVSRPSGGQHVVILRGFDPDSDTVSVDNSWDPSHDFPSAREMRDSGVDPAERITISVKDIYDSMARQSSSSGKSHRRWYWYRGS